MTPIWHVVADTIDCLVPARLKYVIKRVAPKLPHRFYTWMASRTPDELTVVRIRSGPLRGRPILCSLRQHREYFLGHYEEAVAETLTSLVPPGALVIDAGAHLGYFTMLLAELVGVSGRVISIEANPHNAEAIGKTLALNPDLAGRTSVINAAIAGSLGPLRFSGVSASTVGHISDPSDETSYTVQGETLDHVCVGRSPSLIKMDIEGAERLAFDGMRLVMAGTRPPLLLVEVHDEECVAAFNQLLQQHGYEAAVVDQPGSDFSVEVRWAGRQQYLARPQAMLTGAALAPPC